MKIFIFIILFSFIITLLLLPTKVLAACSSTSIDCNGSCYAANGCDAYPGTEFACLASGAYCLGLCRNSTPTLTVQSDNGTTIPPNGSLINSNTVRLATSGCSAASGFHFRLSRYDFVVGDWVVLYNSNTTSNSIVVNLTPGNSGYGQYYAETSFLNGGPTTWQFFYRSTLTFNPPVAASNTSETLSWILTRVNFSSTSFKVKIGSQEFDAGIPVSETVIDASRHILTYNGSTTLANLAPGGAYSWGVIVQSGANPVSAPVYAPSSMSFFTPPRVFLHGITNFYSIAGNVFLDNNLTNIKGSQQNFTAAPITITIRPPVPPPTPPPAGTISDNFNRTDATSLGNTNTGQPWIIPRGSFGISSNQAYPVNGCPAPGYAVVDFGSTDGTLQITLPINPQDTRIPFRFASLNPGPNTYWVENDGSVYTIYKALNLNTALTYSTVSLGSSTIGPANGDTLKIVLDGPSIKLYVNDVLAASATDSDLQGTKYGIGTWCNGSVRFDNFFFYPKPLKTPAPTLAPIVTNTGSYNSGAILPAGTYTVSLPNPLPSGYEMTYPLNSPPSFSVTLGPACINQSLDMTCTSGNITGLNFGVISNIPAETSAPIPTFPANSIFDNFNRANSSTTLGTSISGHVWTTYGNSVMGISSNQAYSASGASPIVALVTGSSADGTVQATFSQNGVDGNRLYFRALDGTNFWYVQSEGNNHYNIGNYIAGVRSGYANVGPVPANGDVIKVVLSGTSINVYVNNISRWSTTNSQFQTATKYGIGSYGAAGTGYSIDDFTFVP